MEKWKNRVVVSVLVAIMLASCVGCTTNGVDKEAEGQSQENVSQENVSRDDGAGNMQGNGIEAEENNSFEHGEYPEPVLFNGECVFAHEVWRKDKTQIQNPGGILCDGESLLVCDMGNHCVVRLTTDGDFVESYGELGSEPGNFVTPTAILLYENEIYVLDSGNMRIQVFDTDMAYVRENLFEGGGLPSNGKYRDMAIAGDGTIYVAADSSYGDGMSLFYIEGGELCVVSGGVLGYLAEQDGTVYAANMYLFYRDNKGYGWKPGENWIYQVDRTGLQKICELPYMYAPADLIVWNDAIYTISTVWGQMNRISMGGELLEELLTEQEAQSVGMYLCMQDENTFYLTEPEGAIWKVFRTEEED